MTVTTLGLILGYKCNIRCRSCLWGDRLESAEVMSVDDVRRFVDLGAELGTIKMVGFTGGEPTLFQRQLRAGIQHAADMHRIPSGFSTNCSWAVSRDKAHKLLSEYYALGLRYLQLSVDDYHDEWVNLERVGFVLRGAFDLGIRSTLTCVVSKSSRRAEHFLERLGLKTGKLLDAVDVPCTPVGYGAQRIGEEDFPKAKGIPKDFCSMLDVINVLPDGSVQTCCGAPFHIDALKAGNAKKRPLVDIVRDAEWNPLFTGLAVGVGPGELVSLLSSDLKEQFEGREYTNSCHACHHVLSNIEVRGYIQTAAEEKRAEYFVRRNVTVQERARRAREARVA